MPTGTRIRTDNVFGTTTDNPLTNVATTMNSAGLANLAAVSANHGVIVLDPQRSAGAPEIVIVTAHTAAATSATITRGAYGTVARQHAAGTLWVHAPTREDFIQILTSATRPSDPYKGQLIFETDTNKLVGYGGTDWAPRDAGGLIGIGQATANQGTITTVVDLTGLTATVTVGTGRRVKILFVCLTERSVADGVNRFSIKEGAGVLQLIDARPTTAATTETATGFVVLSPTAGAHTYKMTLERLTGTGNAQLTASSTFPAQLVVEDIGAA